MGLLQNLKIRTKILMLIIPICLIGIAGVLAVSNNYKQADTDYSDFIANDNFALVQMARAGQRVVALSYNAYQILVYDAQSDKLPQINATYKDNVAILLKRLEVSRQLLPDQAAAIDGFEAKAKAIIAITDRAVEAGMANRNDEATALLAEVDPLIDAEVTEIRAWIDMYTKAVTNKSNLLTVQTNETILWSLVTLALIFSGAILAAIVVSAKGITGPIEQLRSRMISLTKGETSAPIVGLDRGDEVGQMAAAVSVFRDNALERIRLEREADANRSLSETDRREREAQKAREAADTQFAVDGLAAGLARLSDGDVGYRIETPFVAHLDGLRGDFNQSVGKLQQALQLVGRNAQGIDAGANEIRMAADDLSKRTEQQAASVEETAAALEEITTTVKDSAHRAEEAGRLVAKTRAGAEKSGEVVRDAVHAMHQIEKSSNEVSNIIGVIDEIAFQTNLLALNAGVEAARAGEAGKGFAVVAQEVRELAQRSAKAAKEIKALISTSGEQVRAGVELVGKTGASLETIVREVQEINVHVAAIVEASREQSTGLQEINTAVNTMDQGTQQNAAMVEQSTAASHSLAKEAAQLSQLLLQFKIGGDRPQVISAANARSQPTASPARVLARKVAGAFNGRQLAQDDSWEEF